MSLPPAEMPQSDRVAQRRSRRVWVTVLAVLVLLAAAGGGGVWFALRTYHYQVVVPGVLYRDGNQNAAVLGHALTRSGTKTIVSLIDDREVIDPTKRQFQDEEALARLKGVRLIRLPITLGGWPTSDDIQLFLKVANNPANQPVLVHCAQGVRRTGMMVAAYQLSILHYTKPQAIDAIQSFGHSDRTTADVKAFIDAYDPETRTLTKTFTQSSE